MFINVIFKLMTFNLCYRQLHSRRYFYAVLRICEEFALKCLQIQHSTQPNPWINPTHGQLWHRRVFSDVITGPWSCGWSCQDSRIRGSLFVLITASTSAYQKHRQSRPSETPWRPLSRSAAFEVHPLNVILNFSYHSQLWISLIASFTLKTL